jgi:hypothetical protein
VREVLPGRDYFITAQENKVDPITISQDDFAAFQEMLHLFVNLLPETLLA